MEGESSIYGKGMWAGCLRYHEGRFYVLLGIPGRSSYLYTVQFYFVVLQIHGRKNIPGNLHIPII